MKDIEFSALLCSRLCHDLISPVGAIVNGIEILNDEDDEMMRREVMKLLEQSAEATAQRLKFYRLSFGSGGGFGERVPLRDAESAAKGLYSTGKVSLHWRSDVGVMNKAALKLLLNMVLLAGESLIRGGDLRVEIKAQSYGVTVSVTVRGDKVFFQESLRKALLGEVDENEIEAKSAPAFLAANVATKLGSKINYTKNGEQSFSLDFSYREQDIASG